LKKQPNLGKHIFEQLFKNNSLTHTLEFIDESSNWKKELKILSSLPYLPFIKELVFDYKIKLKAYSKVIILLLTTLTCLFLYKSTDYYPTIETMLITAGLVLVGIPHGALDNIVEAKNYHKKIDLLFIIKYIGIALAVVFVWMLHAKIALLFFLAYSAWHFAETDFMDWKMKNNNFIKKMAWGVTLLGIILIGHAKETFNVLSEMGILINIDTKHPIIHFLLYFLIIYSFVWSIIERNKKMLVTTMVLSLSVGLPLLSSFALYFIGQHSTAGWEHLKSAFNVNNIQLFKKTLPYNLAAWILLFVFLNYYNKEFISSFFVFISSISLPHIIIMNKFYQSN
jgi:Brp/Blh family beta-carotene 15,15'-monooxygenase